MASAQTEPAGAIAAAAEQAVRRDAGNAPGLVVAARPPDPRLRLAVCTGRLDATVMGDGQLRATTSVKVGCTAPVRWQIYTMVSVASQAPVLVARRDLSRDTPLQAADFDRSTRRVPGLVANFASDAQALAGQRLRRAVRAGEALQLDALVPADVIHRGQQVALVARGGGVEVRMGAVALADGRVNDRIRVQNQSSHRIVEAIVRSDSLVEVPL